MVRWACDSILARGCVGIAIGLNALKEETQLSVRDENCCLHAIVRQPPYCAKLDPTAGEFQTLELQLEVRFAFEDKINANAGVDALRPLLFGALLGLRRDFGKLLDQLPCVGGATATGQVEPTSRTRFWACEVPACSFSRINEMRMRWHTVLPSLDRKSTRLNSSH